MLKVTPFDRPNDRSTLRRHYDVIIDHVAYVKRRYEVTFQDGGNVIHNYDVIIQDGGNERSNYDVIIEDSFLPSFSFFIPSTHLPLSNVTDTAHIDFFS